MSVLKISSKHRDIVEIDIFAVRTLSDVWMPSNWPVACKLVELGSLILKHNNSPVRSVRRKCNGKIICLSYRGCRSEH